MNFKDLRILRLSTMIQAFGECSVNIVSKIGTSRTRILNEDCSVSHPVKDGVSFWFLSGFFLLLVLLTCFETLLVVLYIFCFFYLDKPSARLFIISEPSPVPRQTGLIRLAVDQAAC